MTGAGFFFSDLAERFSQDQFPPDITQDDQDKTADEGSRSTGGDAFPQKVVLLTLLAYVLCWLALEKNVDAVRQLCLCDGCCA